MIAGEGLPKEGAGVETTVVFVGAGATPVGVAMSREMVGGAGRASAVGLGVEVGASVGLSRGVADSDGSLAWVAGRGAAVVGVAGGVVGTVRVGRSEGIDVGAIVGDDVAVCVGRIVVVEVGAGMGPDVAVSVG